MTWINHSDLSVYVKIPRICMIQAWAFCFPWDTYFPHLGSQRDTTFLDSSLKCREITGVAALHGSSLMQGSALCVHLTWVQAASLYFSPWVVGTVVGSEVTRGHQVKALNLTTLAGFPLFLFRIRGFIFFQAHYILKESFVVAFIVVVPYTEYPYTCSMRGSYNSAVTSICRTRSRRVFHPHILFPGLGLLAVPDSLLLLFTHSGFLNLIEIMD